MNRSMKLTKKELEQLAEKASNLSDWLEEKSLLAASTVVIPPEVVTVTTVVLVTGSALLMDGSMIPDSMCWEGCTYKPI